jgi:hypothetical protein
MIVLVVGVRYVVGRSVSLFLMLGVEVNVQSIALEKRRSIVRIIIGEQLGDGLPFVRNGNKLL